MSEEKTVSQLIAARRRKMKLLREAGVNPFGSRFDGVMPIADALKRFPEGAREKGSIDTEANYGTARIAGRIRLMRDFKKLIFFHVRDRCGSMQAAMHKGGIADGEFKLFRDCVEVGDIVGLDGELRFTKKGEPTLWVASYTVLAKCLRPLPEKFHGLVDIEERHRNRPLDMIMNEDVCRRILARSRMVRLMRSYVEERGFVEVETPIMQPIPGGATARPFVTHHNALNTDLYLRVALELHLKRLLVGGLERVYEIGRCFRNEGTDLNHNPEFTMLELYQAYGDLRTMMELTEGLVSHLAMELNGFFKVPYGDNELDFTPPWPRFKYMELLKEHAAVDPHDDESLRSALEDAEQQRIEQGTAHDFNIADLDRPELLDLAFGEYVEPKLVNPCFVINHPVEISPLCRATDDDPSVVDRFEGICAGMEIANAYTELNDPDEQRVRFERQAARGEKDITKKGVIDEDFLTALEYGMPPAGGIGFGIGRLAMLLTGTQSLREVIAFPLLRPK